MKVLRFWADKHHKDTNTHKDGRRDELTDGETGGRQEGEMEGGDQITEEEEEEEICV